MRLFCNCGIQLMLRREIKLTTLANFTYNDGVIVITKHQLENSTGTQPILDEKDVKTAYCKKCDKELAFSEAYIQCDNCGNHISSEDGKKFGDVIILCPNCVNSCKDYDVFKIFGNRGPSIKSRKKRIEEAINAAMREREMPQELYTNIIENDEGIALNLELPEEESSNPVRTIRIDSPYELRWTPDSTSTGG